MNDKLTAVRSWLAADDARREREKALPKALCRVCGGWARAGEGTRSAEVVPGPVATPVHPETFVMPPRVTAPADADDWRRECAACADATHAAVISGLLGGEVSVRDAARVVGALVEVSPEGFMTSAVPLAVNLNRATGKPWGHVSAEDRARVAQVLAEVVRERQIGPCTQGACGVCGRREHLRWFEGPGFLRWPDGAPAPVCGECQKVIDRRPEPTTIEQLRVIAVEAATGFSQMLYSAPPEFRVYAESKDADGNGHAEPWTYSPGVIEFIGEMWTSHPGLAPEGLRGHYRARFQARIDAWKREAHQRQEVVDAAAW